jgi:hypothetical protein
MKFNVFPVMALLVTGSFVACGGSTSSDGNGGGNPGGNNQPDSGTNPPPGDNDSGAPPVVDAGPVVDHGSPSKTYPAFKPEVGQLINNGGDVLKHPVIVTVTWPGEADRATFEDFGDKIGATDYWKQNTSEYGVGTASSGTANHLHIATAAPAAMSDTDLDTFVATNAGAPATSGWPAPTFDTIYILYLSPSTSLQFGGQDACAQGVGGYHQSTTVNGAEVAYAIVPRCPLRPGQTTTILDETTMSASHELGEAATDPHPGAKPGWVGFDDSHLAYEFFQQFASENGDACEFYKEAFYKEQAPFAFGVQRQWSNASAAAGHHPCVPVPAGAYFNTTPLDLEDITVDLSQVQGPANQKTKGYHVKIGETKTFPIGFFSDADTGGPWSIRAAESNPVFGAPKTSRLKVSVDKTSGQNGEKAYVTVSVSAAGKTKAELITIVSANSTGTHYMPILIGSMDP